MKKSLLQLHAAVFLWGFTGVLGRLIALDAPALVWYRMLLTALILLVLFAARRSWVTIPLRDLPRVTLIGLLMGIHWIAFYGSIKFANASIALVCLSTASIFTSLLDPVVNKTKYELAELMLGLLALAGVCCIYRFEYQYAKGIFFGVAAAILSAVFTVLNKGVAGKYPARTLVFYEMGTGWLLVTLVIALLQLSGLSGFLVTDPGAGPRNIPSAADFGWLFLLALCCTVWAQSLALSALEKLSSFTVTLSVNLEPLYGITLAFIFFRENRDLGWGFYAGMGLICLSVVLQMVRILRPPAGFVREKSGID